MAKPDARLVRLVLLLLLLHLVNLHLDGHAAKTAARLGGAPGLLAALFLVGWHERVRRRALLARPGGAKREGILALFDPAGAASLVFAGAGFGAPAVPAAARAGRHALARAAIAGLAALLVAALVPLALAALGRALGIHPAALGALDRLGATALRLLLLQCLPLPPLDGALLLAALSPALARTHDRLAAAGPWLLLALAIYGALDRLLDAMTPALAPIYGPSPGGGADA